MKAIRARSRFERGTKQLYEALAVQRGLALVAVRRRLYGDGFAAHLLYRLDGEPVSLFVMPGIERPADELRVLGHEELVWNDGAKTYMLVSRTVGRERLANVAAHLRNEAE